MKNYTIWALSLAIAATASAWTQEDAAILEPAEAIEESTVDDRTGDHVHGSLFPLVKYHRKGDTSRLKVPYLPLVSIVKAKKSDEKEELNIVNVPFFKLVKAKKYADGRFDNQFVKLPIIGSLFRHKRTAEKEKVRFLIFSHTRYLDDDDDPAEQVAKQPHRSSRHRGKGSFDRK